MPRSTPNLEDQLVAFATAAAAAGIGIAGSASAAQAEVVYTPVHQVLKVRHPYGLDLNLDGITDFYLVYSRGCNYDSCGAVLFATPVKGNGVEGANHAFALKSGAHIGPDHAFSARVLFSYDFGGFWYNVKHRYLGLKFQISGETHFGWARLNVTYDPNEIRIKGVLTGYAYETRPNRSIIAGDTGALAVHAQSGSTSLGHLALGVLGKSNH